MSDKELTRQFKDVDVIIDGVTYRAKLTLVEREPRFAPGQILWHNSLKKFFFVNRTGQFYSLEAEHEYKYDYYAGDTVDSWNRDEDQQVWTIVYDPRHDIRERWG